MNLNELKNLDIKVLLQSLNGKSLLKGPHGRAILYAGIGVSLLLAYIFLMFIPNLQKKNDMETKISSVPTLEAKVQYLDIATKKTQGDLVQAEAEYEQLNTLFSVESEMEELYQNLSKMASANGLIISALSKESEEPVYPGNVTPKTNNGQATEPQGKPLFYRIKLKVELTGNFGRYAQFRKQLAGFKKSVNIDKEQITLVPGAAGGTIQVKSTLSTYRLPERLIIKPTTVKTSWLDLFISSAHAEEFRDPFVNPNAAKSLKDNEEIVVTPADTKKAKARDPFNRNSNGAIEGGRDARISPLVMADPESYTITGLLISSQTKAAMIRTDYRENFVVRVGDKLGNQGGVIVDIDNDGIVLRQQGVKIRLYLQALNSQPNSPQR